MEHNTPQNNGKQRGAAKPGSITKKQRDDYTGGKNMEEKIIHIWANYSGESFYAEDNKDNWLGDYDTPEEAYTAMKTKYPAATIYRYTK